MPPKGWRKPGSVSYTTRHRRVHQSRGKAREHICIGCGRRAQEWAQRHGTSGLNTEEYDPMCCSCHQKYDDHWNAQARAKVAEASRLRMQDPVVRARARAVLRRANATPR